MLASIGSANQAYSASTAQQAPPAGSAVTTPSADPQSAYQQVSGAQSLLAQYSAGPLMPTQDGWSTVQQGGVGDCYFISSMVDVAKNDPDAIRNLIKPDSNGNYTVDFHGMAPITVDVKGVKNGVQGEGQWSQILEQAWEKHQGNIKSDGTANDWGSSGSSNALTALTGQQYGEKSSNLLQEGLSPSLTAEVTKAVRDGKDVTAATGGVGSFLGLSKTQGGLVGDHVYSVIAADKKGDLEIRNPWGTDKSGNGNGEQWVTPAQFAKDFDTVTVPGSSDTEGKVGKGLFSVIQFAKPAIQDATSTYGKVSNTVSKDYNAVSHTATSVVSGGVNAIKHAWDSVF